MKLPSDRIIGLAEMVCTTLIWGSVSLFSIWSGIPSPIFVFYSVLIAAPLLFAVLRINDILRLSLKVDKVI